MVSGTRCPYVSVCGCEVVRGAAGPEGADDLCCFYLSLKAGIRAWRLELGLEAGIIASRLGFEL